jgi:dienelactone hydrolase
MSPATQPTELSEIRIPIDAGVLTGRLVVPRNPLGVIVFAHGGGARRHGSRNQAVARHLERARLGTLAIDLLTAAEGFEDERHGDLRFDIPRLAERLLAVTDWLARRREARGLRLGYFGASTGAAAALTAASERPDVVAAVVSRGGRPDLAPGALPRVAAPTLLIVDEDDEDLLDLNRLAFEQLRCEKRLEVVPGAEELFDEPSALESAADLTLRWFSRHLIQQATRVGDARTS